MDKFRLNDIVTITRSGESGNIIGAVQYTRSNDQFQVSYVAADGRAVTDWFYEDDLESNG